MCYISAIIFFSSSYFRSFRWTLKFQRAELHTVPIRQWLKIWNFNTWSFNSFNTNNNNKIERITRNKWQSYYTRMIGGKHTSEESGCQECRRESTKSKTEYQHKCLNKQVHVLITRKRHTVRKQYACFRFDKFICMDRANVWEKKSVR